MFNDLIAIDIREAARRLSISPRTVAALISRRELPSRKVGRRRIIPVVALEAFATGTQGSGRTRRTEGIQRASRGTG